VYLTRLKALLVTALAQTFDTEYVDPRFQNIRVGIEYPVDQAGYPGLWVDYDDTSTLKRAGVDHKETNLSQAGVLFEHTRWEFFGVLSITVVALTSLERDDLYDEVIRVIAFGAENPVTQQFRSLIENNPFIGVNMDFDTIEPRGNAAAPGTPWGSDEIIYERTINLNVQGEFFVDPSTGSVVRVPLSAFQITATQGIDPKAADYAPYPIGGLDGGDSTGVGTWH
jgi:hypothetical protein